MNVDMKIRGNIALHHSMIVVDKHGLGLRQLCAMCVPKIL